MASEMSIVGIGASAGGIEALRILFGHMSPGLQFFETPLCR